jgi:hypothetical protein
MAGRTERELQQKHIELYTLYEDYKLLECIQEGKRNLRDFRMPPLFHMKTLWILNKAEVIWHNAEVSCEIPNKPGDQTQTNAKPQQWRKKAESLYEHLHTADENDLEAKREMRFVLDKSGGYHYPPFHEDELEEYKTEWEIDEEGNIRIKDSFTGADFDPTGMSGFDSADDASDDETVTGEDYLAHEATEGKEAAEISVVEESAEACKNMEKTQLGSADEVLQNEGVVSWSEAKARISTSSPIESQERTAQLIGDEDKEMGSDREDDVSRRDSTYDDGDSVAENCFAYKATDQASAEKAATEESAEVGETTQKTQLDADDGVVSPGTSASKPADMTKDSFVTRKTTVTTKTTPTEKAGVTKKTVVKTKTVVVREKILSSGLRSAD